MNIVFLTGAGISSESGLSTYRDLEGIWKEYKIEDVATGRAWKKDKETVLKFHNLMQDKVLDVEPNHAHKEIAWLANNTDHTVNVLTQNIDDLHERAGLNPDNVFHLHGEIMRSCSTLNSKLKYECKTHINIGDKCEKGSQLRFDTVLFDENPYHLNMARALICSADIFVIIGTSLNVAPVSYLPDFAQSSRNYIIDPKARLIVDSMDGYGDLTIYNDINVMPFTACEGIGSLFEIENLKD
jgi:NAD-dependent deacetylase